MSEHKMQPMAEPCHKGFFDGAINLGRCQKDRGHDGACAPERGGYYGSEIDTIKSYRKDLAKATPKPSPRCAYCGSETDDGLACFGNLGKSHWFRA